MPDFYLGSTDSYELGRNPRACALLGRIGRRNAGDIMLVRVDPPLVGEKYRLSGLPIDLVILAPHLAGDTLFPISRWPLHVYVVRTHSASPEKLEFLEDAASDILAWGELYPTEEAARQGAEPEGRA